MAQQIETLLRSLDHTGAAGANAGQETGPNRIEHRSRKHAIGRGFWVPAGFGALSQAQAIQSYSLR
jgi:hypothetical protein